MRKLTMIYIAAVALALAGCESIGAILKDPNQLEAVYKAAAVGDYSIEFKKNGVLLHTERYVCTAEGDLQCKRTI